MDHEDLLQEAKDSINTLYRDRSVSRYVTEASLTALIDDLTQKILSLGIPG